MLLIFPTKAEAKACAFTAELLDKSYFLLSNELTKAHAKEEQALQFEGTPP